MYCIDRASFVYSLAGSALPVLVGSVVLAVGIVLIWRGHRG